MCTFVPRLRTSRLVVVRPGALPWVPGLRDTRNNHSFQHDAGSIFENGLFVRAPAREPEPRRAQLFQIINHE